MQEIEERFIRIVVNILKDNFLVSRDIMPESIICFDLGVCDDEFEDLLVHLANRFSIGLEFPFHIPFSDSDATVADVARWIHKLSSGSEIS